jgi:hypothetical protein
VTDEQRSEAGCIGGQNGAVISGQALNSREVILRMPFRQHENTKTRKHENKDNPTFLFFVLSWFRGWSELMR